jgi:hypothetical protein
MELWYCSAAYSDARLFNAGYLRETIHESCLSIHKVQHESRDEIFLQAADMNFSSR